MGFPMASPNSSSGRPEPAPSDPSVRPVGARELDRLLHIRVPVIAILAEKTMKLREVLDLVVGAIIQLDASVDKPLELMVNNQRIAAGRAVRADDHFGLQLDRLNPVDDTIRKLGSKNPPSPENAHDD
jgi:flagellar motor switch protein FliN/FliY